MGLFGSKVKDLEMEPVEAEREEQFDEIPSLPSPREEVCFAAGEIRRLVGQGALRYRDIALSARTMDRYWEHIEGVFAQYDIPLFQSEKTDILQKPMFTLITAALETGFIREKDVDTLREWRKDPSVWSPGVDKADE